MLQKIRSTRPLLSSCGRAVISLLGVLTLAACAPPAPVAPSFTVMPRPGESFATFQKNDARCRLYAQTQTGETPSQGAASSGVKSAALGTGIGAASGALLGSVTGNAGAGAAIGAGSGLLLGSLIGAGRARQTGQMLQNRYDGAYAQCMVGHGEELPPPPMVYGPPAMIAYPPPAVIYPAPVVP
ncbi:glycine zipper family protein [Acidomonas methanolica]|uniref:glycine zipper family protein n=1 Tax=Acidomonas methanolica TaxID=437 RepID=UPI00211A1986|nr:glycine zipper family protein [Acidomonas methanolica]MCQ9154192.1 glycine zipper family protein [Acidomonas methanolica]